MSFLQLKSYCLDVGAGMLTPDITSNASSLAATAVAQAFALFAALFIAADVSGGHVNPAVTLAFALGGYVSFPTAAHPSCSAPPSPASSSTPPPPAR
jgi:glycerol uptake facilitator-like aquaporin